MAAEREVTAHSFARFLHQVVGLPSFPLFCVYMLLVPLAPVWQKRTKPRDLKIVLVLYNTFCSLLNAYATYGFISGIYHHSNDVYSKQSSDVLQPFFYLYWITKVIELLDTIFMILRHRSRQVSILHVFHHSTMLILSDYARIRTPWPAMAIFLAINSFIHILLYLYYGVAAYKSDIGISWKRRLTELQILQFIFDLAYAVYGYMYAGFCIYGFFYGAIMIYLFCNFYYHAYLKPRGKKRVVENTQNDVHSASSGGEVHQNGSLTQDGSTQNGDVSDSFVNGNSRKQKTI